MEQVRNNDFEDIAVTSMTGSYIYVGDIGNNWGGHCMGIDQSHRMIHIFREPAIEEYERFEYKYLKYSFPPSYLWVIYKTLW